MSEMKFKKGDVALFHDPEDEDWHGKRVKIEDVDSSDPELPYDVYFVEGPKSTFWVSADRLEPLRIPKEIEPEWDE